ncbi:peptidase M23 [Philodulcilactobacillus myokoensis]|uniref:Peptidase M23 n=1 Tax=Philodulcilactobacillus myokoensis TaxID=2929573 RepID=A0A9W6B2S6_9LACO|nr:LysM domain-containing protein [Philodulcilactobacillus myokoensis]GLB47310.1 peptidase M23 [Philodulcilactobacillus myokoensis]
MTASVISGILVTGIGANAQNVTVQKGDTLSSIAQNYNVSLSSFEKKNNLNDKSVISIGQKLVLPVQPIGNPNPQSNRSRSIVRTHSQNYHAKVAQPTVNNDSNSSSNNLDSSQSAAKAWIAFHESSDSYDAQNGEYYGKYQLDRSYLNGDYSPANQERVADQYVTSRYGSWTNAQQHWEQYNWY